MRLLQLTTPTDVLDHWPVFREGHRAIKTINNAFMDEATYAATLTNLANGTDDVFIGLVQDGERDVCYGVAINSTPPGQEKRTFEVVTFYHNPERPDCTTFMQAEFEGWCRFNRISSYLITTRQTRRRSGGTLDCFTSGKFGFKPAYMAFEKKL